MAFPLYLIKSLCEKTVCSIFQFIQPPLFCANSFLFLLNLSYHNGLTHPHHKYPSLPILNPYYVVCTCLLDPHGPAQPTLYGAIFLCACSSYTAWVYTSLYQLTFPQRDSYSAQDLSLCTRPLLETLGFPPHFGSSSWIFLYISSGKSADYG